MANITPYSDGQLAALILLFTRNSLDGVTASFSSFQEQIDSYVAATQALGLTPASDGSGFTESVVAFQAFYDKNASDKGYVDTMQMAISTMLTTLAEDPSIPWGTCGYSTLSQINNLLPYQLSPVVTPVSQKKG